MHKRVLRHWLAIGAAVSAMSLPMMAKAAEPQPYAFQTIPFGAGGFVDGFVYHPKQKDVLYARTDVGGMYRFDYASHRWIPLLDHLGHDDGDLMGVLAIAVDPGNANKVFAACGLYLPDWARKGAILRSDDQGKTWQKTDLPIHVGGNSDGRGSGERLAVDPHDGNVILYGSNQDGLWKSSDGGKTFAKTTSPAASLSLVAFDPAGNGTVYVGSAAGKGGLFVSADGGNTFKPVDGTPNQVPQRVAFAPDGTVYATFAASGNTYPVNPNNAVAGGLWKRDAEGGKWSNISPVRVEANQAFGYSGLDVGPDGTVITATLDRWYPGDEMYASKDKGAHWVAMSGASRHDASHWPWLVNYLKGEDKMGHWMADLKINPRNGAEMIYGTGYGLWLTENLNALGGKDAVMFDFAADNFEEGATIQLASPTGGATLLAALGDIGGGAWDDLTKSPDAGLFRPNTESNFSVDFGGLNPAFVARTTGNDATHGFYSEDSGASWMAFAASPYHAPAQGQPWRGPGTIAVSAKGTSLLWAPEKYAAYYSADKGKTWTASAGWPAGRDLTLVPVSDKAIDGVYYVLDRAGSSVLISVDGGQTFKPIVQGLPKLEGWQNAQLAVVPGRMRDLWLAAPYGLLHSPDANTAMKAVTSVDTAWLVGFGAPAKQGDYPAVYLWGKVKTQAKTEEGLWRSDDEGKSWTRINDDAHQFGGFQAITGDMLEYGTIYVAPHGRGVMVGKPKS
ncbi:WD40/YVTN/BNR-like repeat-containing protein [Asticcacaulis solisilvae]|uniref:WD40/YVTN/BNR-like repeat-containing protein n=1 Tax=Asticcacaulis solisilvae TaxID=1217274 RepID=UPI003FD8E6A3